MFSHSKLLSVLLAGCMMASVLTMGASAAETPSTSSDVSISSDGITKLQDSKQTYTLDNAYGSQTIAFEVKADSPYVKIWCGNTSAHTYYVTVYNSSNVQVDYDTVGAYGNCTLYCNQSALSAGYYKVVVTSENGYSLSGSLAIKTSASKIVGVELAE